MIGDLNGDRKPDIATANGNNAATVSVLANRGDGRFPRRLTTELQAPIRSRSAT